MLEYRPYCWNTLLTPLVASAGGVVCAAGDLATGGSVTGHRGPEEGQADVGPVGPGMPWNLSRTVFAVPRSPLQQAPYMSMQMGRGRCSSSLNVRGDCARDRPPLTHSVPQTRSCGGGQHGPALAGLPPATSAGTAGPRSKTRKPGRLLLSYSASAACYMI